jgi:hypothetical protein
MRIRLALLLLVAVPSAARAQDPPPAVPPAPADAPAPVWGAPADCREPLLGLDIMVGQMSGIRPHVAVFRSERSAVVVEGFYGGLLTKFGQSEGAGAGVRWNFTRGGRDSVTLGPGVDVLFNFRDGEAVFLAPTVDLAWRRDFGDRAGLTLGVNAGIGVGLSGDRDGDRDDPAAGRVTPLISVFGGLRY